MTDLRYPIGKFEWIQADTPADSVKARERHIDILAKALCRCAPRCKG